MLFRDADPMQIAVPGHIIESAQRAKPGAQSAIEFISPRVIGTGNCAQTHTGRAVGDERRAAVPSNVDQRAQRTVCLADHDDRHVVEHAAAIRTRFRQLATQCEEHRRIAPGDADPGPSLLGRLGELHMPVLLLAGAFDLPAINAGMQAMAAELPNAEFHCVDDCAHLPSVERPDAINAHLVRFLT